MAAIQRGDLRGSNRYELGRLGTGEIVSCEGADLTPYSAIRYYTQEQIDFYVRELVAGRREFTAEISSEGLYPEIIRAAEKSFEILPR
jgi:phosphoenolpyruvate carboxykinase (ATP)